MRTLMLLVLMVSTQVGAQYRDGVDLISLHYDFAPDRDDAHSSVAAMTLLGALNIRPMVVTGAVGDGNRSRYINDAPRYQDVIWGSGGHVVALGRWDAAVDSVASVWSEVTDRGGRVYVAEGGQSDFTADVIRRLSAMGRYSRDQVQVIQHSVWNENQSNQSDLNYVRNNARYLKIDDGNGAGATADLNQQSASFLSWARGGRDAREWNEAFRFLNPANKLDFSDTVELLHILGIGTDQISSPDTFARFVDSVAGGNGSVAAGNNNAGTSAGNVIVVEAESFASKAAGWRVMSAHGGGSGTYLELLPDTRVTHSDPLISGQNFWDTPGTGPTITYNVDFAVAGEYRVDARAYSTGSEDNGIHVGINGSWPASGARMQWCTGKHSWTWSSAQRTSSNHCGVPNSITIDVPSAGMHQVMFSAREDGFELDQFRLTLLSGGAAGSYTFNGGSSIGGNADGSSTLFSNVEVNETNGDGPSVDSLVAGVTPSQCVVSGKTLDLAKSAYATDCGLARVDCDPYDGTWLCASFKIGGAAPGLPPGTAGPGYTMNTVFSEADTARDDQTASQYYDICQDGQTDVSGDGFGFQNDSVCVVTERTDRISDDGEVFVSCESPENTFNRQGTNADGMPCVVTNETVGVEIGIATITQSNGGDTILDNAGDFSGATDTDPDAIPELLNDGLDDADELASRVVNFPAGLSNHKTPWSDSYSVGGQCYCDSNFDHGLSGVSVDTPEGRKSVPVVCAAIQARHGVGPGSGRTYFNDIQCGHGPANSAADEAVCPGIPRALGDYTGPNCNTRGSTWNLDLLYAPERSTVASSSNNSTSASSTTNGSSGSWWRPAASDGLSWQLQLQGDIRIVPGVDVYAVDYSASVESIAAAKATGAKLKCYISAGSAENWRGDFGDFPRAAVGNAYDGWPGEWWLDAGNIEALAPVMEARMDACKAKGFDVIDADNVNGFQNPTGFNITRAESINYIEWLAQQAHARGMAFSLKNSESLIPDVIDAVDMLQSESCVKWGNCDAAAAMSAANKPVFAVEYAEVIDDVEWSRACDIAAQNNFSMIYRDLLLTPNGVYRSCGLN